MAQNRQIEFVPMVLLFPEYFNRIFHNGLTIVPVFIVNHASMKVLFDFQVSDSIGGEADGGQRFTKFRDLF